MKKIICSWLYIFIFAVIFQYVKSGGGKSSLTFVIDDTGSMSDDIAGVKSEVNSIFDTVINSNNSQIEDFVLVTFNDPGTGILRTVTKERNEFKKALADIYVDGGGDCPEMSMSGIHLAITKSRHGSLLYVFTDASAKDYEKEKAVSSLARRKEIQVVFVLTGDCHDVYGEDYRVYYQMARETQGQVFKFENKREVSEILKYVKTQINGRKRPIVNKEFPPGTHNLEIEVDSKMKELIISVSGTDPSLSVMDPHGEVAPTEDVAKRENFAIVKVTKLIPGTYSVEVTSSTKHSVVVTADTNVHFDYGFSTYVPASIKETIKRPLPDEPSYVSIELTSDVIGDVILDELLLMDLDNNVLARERLKLLNEKEQFYLTKSTLSPPHDLFRVAIRGHDSRSKKIITRISLTPVEPQSISAAVLNKTPTVSILEGNKIDAEYNHSLQLKCKVTGYPKPKLVWESSDGTILPSTLSLLEMPYDYLSILTIKQINSNDTYCCIARNDLGSDSKQIHVGTIRKMYFNVLKKPTNHNTVNFNDEVSFECKVDAYPPANIHWYKNGREISKHDNVHISVDQSILFIKHMQPHNRGRYMCLAENDNERRQFHFNVYITGVESPAINKKISKIHVKEGSDVTIPCHVINGKPKPRIAWSFKELSGAESPIEDSKDRETVFLSGVTTDSAGTYRCEAYNVIDGDYHNIDLIVHSPPRIIGDGKTEKIVQVGEKLQLDCDVRGEPEPSVRWLLNDTPLELSAHFGRTYPTHGINFYATAEDTGNYTCQASNEYGSVNKTIVVRIVKQATIESPEESTFENIVGERLELPCNSDGIPKPELTWVFYSLNITQPPLEISPREPLDKLVFDHIQIKDAGFYTCIASNVGGSSNFTYEVQVFAPPIIENLYKEKTFTGVVGDLSLVISCHATGNPKPEISWIKDGLYKVARGTYICEAKNRLGHDNDFYDVTVEAYPRPELPTKTIKIKRGSSQAFSCNIPHKPIDYVRWFKDGMKISTLQKYHIENAQFSDAGIYTCRVSDVLKSRSGSIEVKIVFEPRFLYDIKPNIAYAEGLTAVMDCRAKGYPEPEISWWREGKRLPFENMTFIFDMNIRTRGQYNCIVQNEFGSIRRDFFILSEACFLNIETEFKGNQPLLLSPAMTWPEIEILEGHLRIPPTEFTILSCPNGFKNFNESELIVSCNQDRLVVHERPYRFSDLQCRDRIVPVARTTRKNCLTSKLYSENIEIGYEIEGEMLIVYEVCFDMETGIPLYAKQDIQHTLANVPPIDGKLHENHLVPHNIDELYNCELQKNNIYSIRKEGFVSEDEDARCCFSKRFLVNPRDVSPGLPQHATYSSLNLVPHWSTCNTQNWESIERAVRTLARSTAQTLQVYTGTAGNLQFSGRNISIHDKAGRQIPVPLYLWKVVQGPSTKASLAIVQLNIPNLSLSKAFGHLFCTDVCKEVHWMKSKNWRDVKKGYTFCCSIQEFTSALGYGDLFDTGVDKILTDVSLLSETIFPSFLSG